MKLSDEQIEHYADAVREADEMHVDAVWGKETVRNLIDTIKGLQCSARTIAGAHVSRVEYSEELEDELEAKDAEIAELKHENKDLRKCVHQMNGAGSYTAIELADLEAKYNEAVEAIQDALDCCEDYSEFQGDGYWVMGSGLRNFLSKYKEAE